LDHDIPSNLFSIGLGCHHCSIIITYVIICINVFKLRETDLKGWSNRMYRYYIIIIRYYYYYWCLVASASRIGKQMILVFASLDSHRYLYFDHEREEHNDDNIKSKNILSSDWGFHAYIPIIDTYLRRDGWFVIDVCGGRVGIYAYWPAHGHICDHLMIVVYIICTWIPHDYNNKVFR